MITASDFVQRALSAALASAILCAAQAAAQRPVPAITLDKGAKEFAEPFSRIIGLVELRNGRLLVNDSEEKELRLIDFVSETMSSAARTGAGPLEYQLGTLLAGAADTSVLFDMGQRRFLLFSPAGTPVRTTLFGTGSSDPMAFLSMMQPSRVDSAGRVYGQSMGMSMPGLSARGGGVPSMTFADTVAIQRLDLRTGRTDTVARIRNTSMQVAPKMEMGTNGMRMSMSSPNFDATDEWTVLADGTVALLRDGDYRVQFVSPSGKRTGPPVLHATIPVTEQMRRAMMDSTRAQMQKSMGAMEKARNEAGRGGGAMPRIEFEVREPTRWATHLSPYQSLRAAPDGALWVGTPNPSAPLSERTSRFDVLDGTGALIARVVLAPGEQLVGLGRGVVYTIRTDADDLQYLRRYAVNLRP